MRPEPYTVRRADRAGLLAGGRQFCGSSESPCLIEVVHIHHDEDGVRINLSGRIAADQPRLRADMVTALLLGIGVLRVLLNKEPIATATDRDIATIFNEAFHSLTKLPRGSNESAAS
jgi:Tetracyclin repressor-like, C-terminal domain